MKQITKLMIVAASAAALVSCAKEKDFEPVLTPSKGIQISVIADMPKTESATKTELNSDKSVSWKTSDKVGFINGEDGVNVESSAAVLDAEGRATFTAEVPSVGTYYAYYPYFNDASYAPNSEGVTVRIPNIQKPALTSFDPAADILVSEGFDVTDAGENEANLRFRRLGSFIKLYFVDNTTGGKLSGQFATSISIDNSTANAGNENQYNLVGRFRISGTEGLVNQNSGYKAVTVQYERGTFDIASGKAYFGIVPQKFVGKQKLLVKASTFGGAKAFTISKTIELPENFSISEGQMLPIKIKLTDKDVTEETTSLQIETVWSFQSGDGGAWNTVFGGAAGSDRNIAMDDEYVYVAENTATAKMWAISISDKNNVTPVNVTGVTGGTHSLACPRVIKNEEGNDILVASNLTRGGEEPKLYMWLDGFESAPRAFTLQTWATGAWYGDVFTVYGTMQSGILLFDKIGGNDANVVNGVVTFNLAGIPSASTTKYNLVNRIAFNGATITDGGTYSHQGAAAYYPFPGEMERGIFAPGRGIESRGFSVALPENVTDKNFLSGAGGAFTPTLTKLDYADGRNGFVLAYNYIEWKGKRYVIYGKQEDSANGHVYVLEGDQNSDWLTIANTAGVKFRRDISASGYTSGNSGMDVTARVIGDYIYIAVQKQNVGCSLFRIFYGIAE